MTTIEGLASRIAQTYNIDFEPARDLVSTYAGQVSDDQDLWNADAEILTPDGVEVVTEAISEGYARKIWSTAEAGMIDELYDVTARQQELIERRDQLIRSLMGTSVARAEIAAAARVSEPRLYQIRDGRR